MERKDTLGVYSSGPTCNISPSASQWRFTPVAVSKLRVPRLWDRKPSTPLVARSKPRKLWKRFRSSSNSMKQLRRPAGDEADELVTEINLSTRNGLTRGVKRRCLDIDGPGVAIVGGIERGRSFLETKWELDTIRRRKYATYTECDRPTSRSDTTTDCQDEPSHEIESAVEYSMPHNPLVPNDEDPTSNSGSPDENTSLDSQLAPELPAPTEEPSCDQPGQDTESTSVSKDAKTGEIVADKDATALAQAFNSDCHRQDTQDSHESGQTVRSTPSNPGKASRIGDRRSPGLDGPFPTISVVIEHKSQSAASEGKAMIAEEATLIRSALRSSALDGEDEELLNDFLSRAKAKRAANAAGTPKKGDQSATADLLPESPTPRSRRALEELDTNSPSLQPASPVKTDGTLVATDEDSQDAEPVEPEDPQLASPTRRRSSRTKPKKTSKRAVPPAVPNQIPVRRPKGTEFVFLQRTEAQELALTTRRNTKRNRGTAQMPKQMLAALAQRQDEDSDSTTSSSRSHRRRGKGKGKTVSWSEQLVDYERDNDGGGDDVASSHVGARRGRIARRSGAGASAKAASTAAVAVEVSTTASAAAAAPSAASSSTSSAASPAPPAPATPRARRLPLPGALSPANKLAPDNSLIPTAITTSSDSDLSHRKRLAPKAPSAALLGASKGTITRSRLPARTTAGSTSSKTAIKKSTSILHAGAGSTPMPKRVRARR